MRVAIWASMQTSLEEALVEVVMAGGDTDTNGPIAGAVLGARFEAAAVPKRWTDNIADIGQIKLVATSQHMSLPPVIRTLILRRVSLPGKESVCHDHIRRSSGKERWISPEKELNRSAK